MARANENATQAGGWMEAGLARRILVVDDDPGIRNLLRDGLALMGFSADLAETLSDARERLRTSRFSLVLCDFELPDGDGLAFLEHLRQVRRDLPFILLTGHDTTSLARDAIAAGAQDFLAKPFTLRELRRLMEQSWARLERDRLRTAELTREVLTGTIRALVAAVDAKDPHTASHSERVCRLALGVGEALRLPKDRLQVLEFSALLHDVGKIAVPESILLKPGPLTEEEWAVIRRHPVRSAEIVSRVGALAEVGTIVRHHHERPDGSGYPDGLEGDAIPPLSRIIALADAYEAMTSDRSYRRAHPPEHAREVIRAGLGLQFDPSAGAAMLSIPELP